MQQPVQPVGMQPGAPAPHQTIVVVQGASAPPEEVACCCCIPMSMGIWFVGLWQVLNCYIVYASIWVGLALANLGAPTIGVVLIVMNCIALVFSFSFWVFVCMGMSAGMDSGAGRRKIRMGVMMLQLS